MKLNQLTKISGKPKKRLGRGHGSGRGGHTSSRGAKGDNARGSHKLLFEGVKTKKSLIKRLPFTRGKDKHRPASSAYALNLNQLAGYKKGELVDHKSLFEKGLISNQAVYCKLLANGAIKVALKVAIPCSKSAIEKITQAGGEIITAS